MRELFSTRSNHLIDPGLFIWGWEIPVYLFFGGLVAGFMIISGYFTFKGHHKHSSFSSFYLPHLSLLFLTLGMFALFLDLEHKLYVWRLYTTFKWKSPMSWGSWILLLVYPALWLNTLVSIPGPFRNRIPFFDKVSEYINRFPALIKNIGVLNMLTGAILGMYTGILLSAFNARPFWNSAILGPLFLVSGLSTGLALNLLLSRHEKEQRTLGRIDVMAISVELFLIIHLFMGLLASAQVHISAAQLFLGGPYTAPFWIFVVALGLVLPAVIELLEARGMVLPSKIPALLVLMGGLLLRFIVVEAGQASHWAAQ